MCVGVGDRGWGVSGSTFNGPLLVSDWKVTPMAVTSSFYTFRGTGYISRFTVHTVYGMPLSAYLGPEGQATISTFCRIFKNVPAPPKNCGWRMELVLVWPEA